MFGFGKKDDIEPVIVFTVSDLPWEYIPIETVVSVEAGEKVLIDLGRQAAILGGDGVIGLAFQHTSEFWYNSFGTVIKFIRDNDGKPILKNSMKYEINEINGCYYRVD